MLMECPECNGKVSDTALACPHCGNTKFRKAESVAKVKKERPAGARPMVMFIVGVPMSILWICVSIGIAGLVTFFAPTIIAIIVFCGCIKCVWDFWIGKMYGATTFCLIAPLLCLVIGIPEARWFSAVLCVALEAVLIAGAIAVNRIRSIKEWVSYRRMKRFAVKM